MGNKKISYHQIGVAYIRVGSGLKPLDKQLQKGIVSDLGSAASQLTSM